jgi:hypothetical protein
MLSEEFIKHVRKANRILGFTGRPIDEVRDVFIECTEKSKTAEAAFRVDQPLAPRLFGGHTFLVYRGSSRSFLWTVETNALNPNPRLLDIDSESLSAGANDTATFFMDRYFHRVPKKMEALIPLAVHTALMAESEYVKGIQVGIFTRNEFRILTNSEIKPHIRASKRLAKDVDALVLKELRRKDESQSTSWT